MNIEAYNKTQSPEDEQICDELRGIINTHLVDAESKIWHGHPVWFLVGNPIVGYSKQKAGVRLMFWSGADFGEEALNIRGKKFKDASIFYTNAAQIDKTALKRWLETSRTIQWDYKNIVKRRGKLERLL